jgi:hypothetical protein
MATTETRRYRGYDIVPMRQWSQWCVGIYPTRADLPILTRSTLSNLAAQKEDRSQTDDRPHSRTPELSIREVIYITSALVGFC